MTVQKEWALASMVFLLLTIVFSTVIYWYLYPVAEIVLIPPFRLSAYWCFPQALQFPIRRLTRWDLVCAFGTKAHIEVFFPKRIQKVPPPLAERLGRSTSQGIFSVQMPPLDQGVLSACFLALFLQYCACNVKHPPVQAFAACDS